MLTSQQILIVLVLVAILGLLILVACRGGDSSSAELSRLEKEISEIDAEAGAITTISCPLKIYGEVEGETYECGVYTVPVNYDDPESKTINLTFVRLFAGDEATEAPIVFLAGGPGQSGILAAGRQLYGDLSRDRDLIFPAQRGTLFAQRLALEECVTLLGDQLGRSELQAFVDSVSTGESEDRSLPYDQYLAQYSETVGAINGRCHEAFRQAGLDPAQFNTGNSANDLVGLMQALGYDSYSLHGTSYGTRLALETLRRHPQAPIRSMVLDSPSTPTVERLSILAVAPHEMVMQLFANCTDDAACNEAYPDLLARTEALLAQLASAPLAAGEQQIGPDEVIAELLDLGGTRGNYIPRMIAELEAGDTTTYLALSKREVGTTSPEGSTGSQAVNDLVQRISLAGLKGTNPLTGLQAVKDVLDGTQEDNPRAGMKANAERVLADSESLPDILEAIDALTDEEVQQLKEMMSGSGTATDQAAVALFTKAGARNNAHFLLSGIACLEQLPFSDARAALDRRDGLAIPALGTTDAMLATEVGNCTNYPMGEPDPAYGEPVNSAVPTLILQGEYDTRTPPDNGRALAEQLDNATLVIVPQAGHETWTGDNCASRIGISFLRAPDQPLDLSCLQARQHRFSLPGDPLDQ
jgi:pimeloyl-ACP methyl ester carboxylesterase